MVETTISAVRNANPDNAVTGREIIILDDGLSGTTKASLIGDTSLAVSGTTLLDYILKYILAATFNIGNTVVAATKKLTLGVALTAGYFLNIKLDATNTKGIEVHDGTNPLFSVEADGTAKCPSIQSRTANPPLIKNTSGIEVGFCARAWVNFDGTSAANVTATYVRTGTSVVVTLNGHGHLVGHQVYADFTSGTAVDGLFTITAADTNTFTFTHGTSGNTSGNVTLNRRLIRASGNIHSITYNAAGDYTINFANALPDANYSPVAMVQRTASDSNLYPSLYAGASLVQTVSGLRLQCRTGSSSVLEDPKVVSVAVFR